MVRNRHNNDSRCFHTWLESAKDDLIASEMLLNNSRCYKIVAFHCQQALEKVLKAYILFKKNKLLDGHNLLWLCRQAARYDGEFLDFLNECAFINHCYIETRYPSDLLFKITDKQIKKFFISTKEIYEIICNKIYSEYKHK